MMDLSNFLTLTEEQQEQQERLEQALALYDALNPEVRRLFIQIMRDMVAEQEKEKAIQTA